MESTPKEHERPDLKLSMLRLSELKYPQLMFNNRSLNN